MKKTLLLVILFAAFLHVAAQKRSAYSITLSPGLLYPAACVVKPGIEISLGNQFSVQAETALPIGNCQGVTGMKLFLVGTELKLHFNEKETGVPYISLQAEYTNRSWHQREGSYNALLPDTAFSYHNAGIQSPIYVGAFKLGIDFNPHKKYYMDAFVAMGIRKILTVYEAPNKTAVQALFYCNTIPPAWQFNYTITKVHFVLGFRVGRRID